jgi:hypothetical protein
MGLIQLGYIEKHNNNNNNNKQNPLRNLKTYKKIP